MSNDFDKLVEEVLNEGPLGKWLATGLAAGSLLGSPDIASAKHKHHHAMTQTIQNKKDYAQNILARTIWSEGRGEPDINKSFRSIATTIVNRKNQKVNDGKISDNSTAYVKICLTPLQYSSWNGWTSQNRGKLPPVKTHNGKEWDLANQIAKEILNGTFQIDGSIGQSTHYYNPYKVSPRWARNEAKIKVGNHVFLIEPQDFPSPIG